MNIANSEYRYIVTIKSIATGHQRRVVVAAEGVIDARVRAAIRHCGRGEQVVTAFPYDPVITAVGRQTVLPRTAEIALLAGVPSAYAGLVAANFDRVVRAASACAFPGRLGGATADELGLSAALYALAGYINGPREWPDTWVKWAGKANGRRYMAEYLAAGRSRRFEGSAKYGQFQQLVQLI